MLKIYLLGLSLFFACFVHSVQAQEKVDFAKSYVLKNNYNTQLDLTDLRDMVVSDAYYSKSTGFHHVILNQSIDGYRVYNAIYNLAIKNDRVFNSNHTFVKNAFAKKATSATPSLGAYKSILRAAAHIERPSSNISKLREVKNAKGLVNKMIFSGGSLSRDDIKTELIWVPNEDKTGINLAWNIEINDSASSDWWNIRIDAHSGAFISKNNFTVYCKFDHVHKKNEPCSQSTDIVNLEIPNSIARISQTELNQQNILMAPNTYGVFDTPAESPKHSTTGSFLSDNRDDVSLNYTRFSGAQIGPDAATNGWHDDGTFRTITRGNNVHAYQDTNNSSSSSGDEPNGGGTLDFSKAAFAYNPTGTSASYQDAAVVNLFYWSNLIHDVLYVYGFDEACGNFQQNNLGRGGNGGDYVFAEAQDGGGLDNANFSTPADGGNGRMQMYLWSNAAIGNDVSVNSPAGVAGAYAFGEADFDPATYDVTAEAVYIEDAGAATSEGCTANLPYNNAAAINGKIALIDRGTCGFLEKAQNAEAANALGVIICNNVAGSPAGMTGTGTVNIPTLMLSQADCATLKATMTGSAVNMTLFKSNATFTPDGDFDNGIVAHEYGHGWSTRSTGGPSNSSCLGGDEQMGEGWSDFLALMLCTDWSSLNPTVADANIARGIGTYAIGQPTTGGGIRPFPYSYDMAGVNADVDYANINNGNYSIPHGVGSMWCTILWDMTWEMIFQDGAIENNIWNVGNQIANVAAFKLVQEGLKLQPCTPGMEDGRDAILAADQALYGGKYKCTIWKAFARRGLGANADQGGSASIADGTADYTLPGGIDFTKTVSPVDALEGDPVTFTLTAQCGCADQNNITVEDLLPSGFTYQSGGSFDGSTVSFPSTNLTAAQVQNFSFTALVSEGTCTDNDVVHINDDLDGSAPAGGWTSTKLGGNGNKNWVTNTTTTNSPSTSWYAQDYANAGDIVLSSNTYTLNGVSEFSFFHRYHLEFSDNTIWDCGVVEITTDGGTTWEDLGPFMTANGYDGNSGSFGRNSFGGDSGTAFKQTVIDLSNFCGETVSLRFRLLCDGNTAGDGINGWYIDDISMVQSESLMNTGTLLQGGASLSTSTACLNISQCLIPVPVEMTHIAANAERSQINLDWTTATERNNLGFEVGRSLDSRTGFEQIGFVEGAGNTSNTIDYTFADKDVRKNITYFYRLKQVDLDGSFEYSEIVSAELVSKSLDVSITPNPAKQSVQINIQGEVDAINISLFDIQGKLISNLETRETNYSLNTSNLTKGMYILKIQSNGRNVIKKLLIQ